MTHLFGLTDHKDIIFVQCFLLLQNRGVNVTSLSYIRTHGESIDQKVKTFWKLNNIDPIIHALPDQGNIENDKDFQQQEERIARIYCELVDQQKELFVFIGGGHKLHSGILQRISTLFGAQEVFHLLIDHSSGGYPDTVESVRKAISNKEIHFISFGSYVGWPALSLFSNSSDKMMDKVNEVTRQIGNRHVDHVNEFPFECLNILPQSIINWLRSPLTENDNNWILSLPKAELHCHMGGFATHGRSLNEVRSAAEDSIPPLKNISYPADWPLPDKNIPLIDYMRLGDNNGSYILKDMGCLKKQIRLMYKHFLAQNIVYAEVRCSPYNYATDRYSADHILDTMITEFQLAMENADQDNKCHVNLIIIATRKPKEGIELIEKHIALAQKYASISAASGKCKVVGIDLAGYEHETTRGSYFELQFEPIHKNGIDITIHAGENDDAPAIWDAVFKLNTRRIGHGLRLYQDEKLMQAIINRNIGLEMCPYANYQIAGFKPMRGEMKNYPLRNYIEKGVKVTVNTDNIGISDASLTDNFVLLTKLTPGITRMEILELIRNSMEQSFISTEVKTALLKEANKKIFDILYMKK